MFQLNWFATPRSKAARQDDGTRVSLAITLITLLLYLTETMNKNMKIR